MRAFLKCSLLSCTPLLSCISAFAMPVTTSHFDTASVCCGRDNSDQHHKCKGKCPLVATDYTTLRGTHLEFKVDDQLPTDPIPSGPAAMQGFPELLGFDPATTEEYWRAGLRYVKYRFGIDATSATFDPVLGLTFLTVAPDGSSVQTPVATPSTNVVISPVTFTGAGTYRVMASTASIIETSSGCRPLVRLAEFILTFTGDVTLSGTYGTEASATGFVVEAIHPGQTVGGGIAFGRYAIRGKDGRDQFFDMRSWIPSRRWPSNTDYSYYIERLQINPLNRDLFGGSGLGSVTIVYPAGPVQTPEGPVYPWYVRSDWWLGPTVSHPFLVDWDGQCPEGNTSLILPPQSATSKCRESQ